MTSCDKKYLEFIGLEGELDDFARSQHQYIVWCHGYEAGQHNKFIGEYLDRKVGELEEQIEKMRLDQKTAFIKGMRHLAKALFEYDKKFGAQTDYFIHAIEIVLEQELDKFEVKK